MSWFSTGYEKVEQRAKEVEEALNREYIPEFFLTSDQEAAISFVTSEPFNFYQHYLQQSKRYFTCSQDGNCVLCASGNKATFSSAYLIVDHRYETWADKKTGEKKERQNTLKLAKFGIRAAKALAGLNKKRGLGNFAWEITRTGSGNDTIYTFLPSMDIQKITPELKKTTNELMMEALAPKPRDQLLKVLSGSGVVLGGQQGGGQQTGQQQNQGTYNKPSMPDLDMIQDDDVVDFNQ